MSDLESVISGAVESAGLASGDNLVEASDGTTTDMGTGDLHVGNDEEVGSVASSSAPPANGEEVAEVVETPAATGEVKVAETAEDAFAKEHGLTPTKPGQRENRIPYSRVKQIAANAETKAESRVAELILGAKPAADKPVIEQIQARLASFNDASTKVKSYEDRLVHVDVAEKIMMENPEQFLEILPQINPKYAELLTGKRTAEPTTGVVTGDDPRPEPDIEFNGQKTYSLEGLEKRFEWERRQAQKEAMAQVDPVLKPIKERAEAEKRINAAAAKTVSQVKHAEDNWPNFKEHADEILKTLQDDKPGKLSLMDAYTVVINRKHEERVAALTVDHNKVRANVLAELKKTPTSTSTGPSATGVVKNAPKPGTRSLETVIAERVAAARRG
jgi:hypothetical protein